MDSQKFGTFIAQCRKDKKMTQADLAAKLNVTDKAISRWERGVGFPDINTIEPLAAALDVSVAELMKSERIDESEMSIVMNNEIVDNALNFAEKQIQQERKNVFSIIGCLTVAIIFILYLDNIGWQLDTFLFTVVGIILPLIAILSFLVLLGYAIYRKCNGQSCHQTFLIALAGLGIVALIFGAFMLAGTLGLGPVPQ